MLGKILKYDLRWVFKEFLYLYPIILADALLILILPDIAEYPFLETVKGFAEGAFLAFMPVMYVTTLKIVWTRMSRSMYGDEAYLTRTLPTSIGTIFTAKVLNGIIVLLVNVAFCVIAASIAYPEIWGFVAEFSDMVQTPTTLVILIASVSFIMQGIFVMMAGFLGITIGYRFRNQHFAWSVVAGMIVYLVGSVVLVGVEYLIAIAFDKNLLYFFTPYHSNDPISALRHFLLIAATGYAIYNIACYVAGRVIQNRGTDID